MENVFQEEISQIFSKHQVQSTNEFNIFSALHNNHDERRLHSRFISNLLSPNSGHSKNNEFLIKFIKLLGLTNFDLNEVNVTPNEFDKSEWKNIDIYIRNEHQAIIIENKIFAKDSNYENEEKELVPQLINYYQKIKEELKLSNNDALQNIHLVYLTLNGKDPSYIEHFKKAGVNPIKIDYIRDIPSWLEDCLQSIDDYSLKDAIRQYKKLLFNITNNFNLTMELKSLISDNIEAAYEFLKEHSPQSLFRQQLIHVKWHSVHEFWSELGLKLQNALKVKINLPSDDLITKTTHKRFKKGIALNFTYQEKHVYISNDKKGFTWGVQNHWDYFCFSTSKNIIFSDFDNIETFKMINIDYQNEIIKSIISEIAIILKNKIDE